MSTDHKERKPDVLDWLSGNRRWDGSCVQKGFQEELSGGLPVRTWRRQEWAGCSVDATEALASPAGSSVFGWLTSFHWQWAGPQQAVYPWLKEGPVAQMWTVLSEGHSYEPSVPQAIFPGPRRCVPRPCEGQLDTACQDLTQTYAQLDSMFLLTFSSKPECGFLVRWLAWNTDGLQDTLLPRLDRIQPMWLHCCKHTEFRRARRREAQPPKALWQNRCIKAQPREHSRSPEWPAARRGCEEPSVVFGSPESTGYGRVQHAYSVLSHSSQPHGLQPTRLLCPWVLRARILERVAISFSRESSWPMNWTHIPSISCIAGSPGYGNIIPIFL